MFRHLSFPSWPWKHIYLHHPASHFCCGFQFSPCHLFSLPFSSLILSLASSQPPHPPKNPTIHLPEMRPTTLLTLLLATSTLSYHRLPRNPPPSTSFPLFPFLHLSPHPLTNPIVRFLAVSEIKARGMAWKMEQSSRFAASTKCNPDEGKCP